MSRFIRLFSYLFHPLFMPLLGAFFYWELAAKTHAKTLVLPIAVATLLLPIISYFLLKRLGYIRSMITVSLRERVLPLALQTVYLFSLLKLVDFKGSFPLYNFYVGCMVSALLATIVLIGKIKASLHMIGITGVLAFVFLLGFYLDRSVLIPFCSLALLTGLVGSSRLEMKAHTPSELLWGSLLGIIPQLMLASVWM